jgi:hypothetical protein
MLEQIKNENQPAVTKVSHEVGAPVGDDATQRLSGA